MSSLSPAVIIYNADGSAAITITNGVATPAGIQALVVAGSDGTNLRFMRTAADGTVRTDPTGTTAQPVTDGGGSLTVDGSVSVSNLPAVQPVNDNGGSLTVDGPLTDAQLRAAAVPVSAASLPLPAGAATEATLALIKAKTDNLDVALSTRAVTGLTDAQLRATAVPVSATQLPAALVGGRLDENIGAWLGSTAPTVGQKTKVNSLPVTFASDQEPIAIFVDSPAGATTGITSATITLGGGTAGTLNLVSGSTYNEQTTGAQRSISSSSASDSSAGVGAREVQITYYTAALVGPLTEVVTLNGTTAVATVATDICFIEKMVVTEVGSTTYNVGTLTLYVNNAGGGGTIGTIAVGTIVVGVGDNRTFWGHHYIATGLEASLSTFIVAAISGGSGTNATLFLRAKNPLTVNEPEVIISDLLLTNGGVVRLLTNPIKLLGPRRVRPFGVPAVNNVTLNASFDWAELAV